MLDLLKKIGVPATVAAVIASLVTIVPFLFKVDERYAKDEDVDAIIAKFEKKIDKQNREIAQLAGFQQAMIQLMAEGRAPRASVEAAPIPAPAPRPPAFRAPPAAVVPPVLRAPEPVTAPPPAPPASAVLRPLEKPKNWTEIQEGLLRQQSRLIKD